MDGKLMTSFNSQRVVVLLRTLRDLRPELSDAQLGRLIGYDRATIGRWRDGMLIKREIEALRVMTALERLCVEDVSPESLLKSTPLTTEKHLGVEETSLLGTTEQIIAAGEYLVRHERNLEAASYFNTAASKCWVTDSALAWRLVGKALRATRVTGSLEMLLQIVRNYSEWVAGFQISMTSPEQKIAFADFLVEQGCFLTDHGEFELFNDWSNKTRTFLDWANTNLVTDQHTQQTLLRLRLRNLRDCGLPPWRSRLRPHDSKFKRQGKKCFDEFLKHVPKMDHDFIVQQQINTFFGRTLNALFVNDRTCRKKAKNYLHELDALLGVPLEPWRRPDQVRPPYGTWTAAHFIAMKAMASGDPKEQAEFRGAAQSLAAWSGIRFLGNQHLPIASFVDQGLPKSPTLERIPIDMRTQLGVLLKAATNQLGRIVVSTGWRML